MKVLLIIVVLMAAISFVAISILRKWLMKEEEEKQIRIMKDSQEVCFGMFSVSANPLNLPLEANTKAFSETIQEVEL